MKALAVLATSTVLALLAPAPSRAPAAACTSAQAVITPDGDRDVHAAMQPVPRRHRARRRPGLRRAQPEAAQLHRPTWQKSVTDEQIKKTILYGGAAVGKSPAMPANPDLDGKPELDGLVAMVRSFNGK